VDQGFVEVEYQYRLVQYGSNYLLALYFPYCRRSACVNWRIVWRNGRKVMIGLLDFACRRLWLWREG
jgi:hypothetical protein